MSAPRMRDATELGALPPAGAHGDDVTSVADALGRSPDEIVDLAQTTNPVAPDVVSLARRHLGALARYPDPARATAALARALEVDEDRVVLTNGGAEAIALVAAHEPRGWVDEPDFSLYREHLVELDPTAGVWRSNPHNPSGRLASEDRSAAVWDEAFWPLTTGTWTRGDADRGSIVVGSLTKLFACPGLRAGYVLAPDRAAAESIRARQPRWSVNALATSVLPELVERADLPAWASEVRGLRSSLVHELRRRGVTVAHGEAPWLLVTIPALRTRLARHGVLVRDCESFGMKGVFRMATPRAIDLPAVLTAFDRILEEGKGHD